MNMIFVQVLFLCYFSSGAFSKKFDAICKNVTADPEFDEEAVIGSTWIVYYTWKNKLPVETCIDVTFKEVTMKRIERYMTMQEDLLTVPNWPDAKVVMSKGLIPFEMMLFPDYAVNKSGIFLGLKFHRENETACRPIVMTSYALKLISGGQHLLISDCTSGFSVLAVRKESEHTMEEIQLDVGYLKFDYEGYPTCKLYGEPEKKKPTKRPFFRPYI